MKRQLADLRLRSGFSTEQPIYSGRAVASLRVPSLELAAVADAYPHLATVQRELVGSGFDYADEFEAGLDIILGAYRNLLRAERSLLDEPVP